MSLLASILLLALTRAEILERMKAPVITQVEGLVQVYSNCPEDMRREFQMPIASFAAETVKTMYRGLGMRTQRFSKPGIVIHVGDVRTNDTEVIARVSTNGERIVSRIYLKSPGYADVNQLRLEVVKGFYRSVVQKELTDEAALKAYRLADPEERLRDERMRLEDWLAGRGTSDDEEGLRLMRKIFAPGRASRRDVLIFASRLFLYPPAHDLVFAGRYKVLSFREAIKFAKIDPCIRIMASLKANEMPVMGGGKGEVLSSAAAAYRAFLLALGDVDKEDDELKELLEEADIKLNLAFEKADRI